jgi:hypothetical protein
MIVILENCADTITCVRVISTSAISGVLIIIGARTITQLYKFRNKLSYEIIPLLTATLQAAIYFCDYIFFSSNRLIEIANFL